MRSKSPHWMFVLLRLRNTASDTICCTYITLDGRSDQAISSRNFGEPIFRDHHNELVYSPRKPEMLPPAEIRNAITAIVQVRLGVAPDEAVVETGRLFGFRSTSPQLKQVIEREMNALVAEQVLNNRNSKLYVGAASTSVSN